MNEQINLQGSIDLLKLEKSVYVKLNGTPCIVIPVTHADIYMTAHEDGTPKSAYLGISVLQSKEVSEHGNTHYVKPSISKTWRDNHTEEEVNVKKKTYLGNLKPLIFERNEPTAQEIADGVEGELPF